jgi:hypothetical protein
MLRQQLRREQQAGVPSWWRGVGGEARGQKSVVGAKIAERQSKLLGGARVCRTSVGNWW